jgi:hypothetical protein
MMTLLVVMDACITLTVSVSIWITIPAKVERRPWFIVRLHSRFLMAVLWHFHHPGWSGNGRC